jgi:hypothetical protein
MNWLRFSQPRGERPEGLSGGLLRATASAQFAPLAGGIVIGIGRFLARPDVFGDVAQVDANSGPGGGAAAHGVDQDVVHGEIRRCGGVFAFPAYEAGEGSFAIGRVGDSDQRQFGAHLGGGASA